MGRPARSFWNDGLNERERIVVNMLAAGNTIRATAIKAGITERTVYAMRQKKHIQDAIYAHQVEMFDGSGSQGLSLLPEVVGTLRDIVNDPEARASDRIQASRALISSANEYQGRRILERKIRDLERQLFGATHIDPEPGDGAIAYTPPEPEEDPVLDVLATAATEESVEDLSDAEIEARAAALVKALRSGAA